MRTNLLSTNLRFGDYSSLYNLTSGNNNLAFGRSCMFSLKTGSNNLCLGNNIMTMCGETISDNLIIGNSSG